MEQCGAIGVAYLQKCCGEYPVVCTEPGYTYIMCEKCGSRSPFNIKDENFEKSVNIWNTKVGKTLSHSSIPLSESIEVLKRELSRDKRPGSYYHSWQSNLAQVILANTTRVNTQQANMIAKSFLELFLSQGKF